MKFNIRKFRKNMLKLVNGLMWAVFLISGLSLDAPSWIPSFACFVSGLWLLAVTDTVKPPERKKFASGKTMPEWYADLWHLPKSERAKARSKTFPGIAKAMAEQWG